MARSKLLNIGSMGGLALHIAVDLAKRYPNGEAVTAEVLSRQLAASVHTVHKVVTRMVEAGVVESSRGVKGGLRLASDPGGISLFAVLSAVEGPLDSGGCLFAKPVCGGGGCAFAFLTRELEDRARHILLTTTLSDTTTDTVLRIDQKQSGTTGRGGE